MNCQSCNNTIFLPFKLKIPEGKCHFDVDIPEHVLEHTFHFEDLDLVPGFYSMQASQMKLNYDDEYSTPFTYPFGFEMKRKKQLIPDLSEYTCNTTIIRDFMNSFNAFVDTNKPTWMKATPVIFDWVIVDAEGKPYPTPMNRVIENDPTLFFGKEDLSTERAYQPSIVENMPHVNKYILCDDFHTMDNLRIRIWIAPKTKLILRSSIVVDGLGFTDQLQEKNKQFILTNGDRTYKTLVALKAPLEAFSKAQFKITVTGLDVPLRTDNTLLISNSMINQPLQVQNELNDKLEVLGDSINVKLRVFKLKEAEKYRIDFPESSNIEATLHLPKAIANTLGFSSEIITKETKSLPVSNSDGHLDILQKCRALANDTSNILVTQRNMSSSNLINSKDSSTNHYVATLKPNSWGVLSLSKLNVCIPALNLNALNPSEIPGHRKVQFQLSTFDDYNRVVPLEWPCSSYLQGMLIGQSCVRRSTLV